MPPEVATGSMVFSIPFTALFVAYFAFVPAVVVMLLAELLGKRDWLFYALAGGFVALVVVGLAYQSGDAGFAYRDPLLPVSIIGSGLVGGIAYWFVTGRFAGALARIDDAYFACAVMILSAKAEKTPANR